VSVLTHHHTKSAIQSAAYHNHPQLEKHRKVATQDGDPELQTSIRDIDYTQGHIAMLLE
jgi:hypothetical protein